MKSSSSKAKGPRDGQPAAAATAAAGAPAASSGGPEKRKRKAIGGGAALKVTALGAPSPADTARIEHGLEIFPGKGEFINFDVDTTYVMPFRVCNRSTEIQTLRFVAPSQSGRAFRLVNMESVRLAAGLSHVLEVEFVTHTTEDYSDSFTILKSDGTSVVVSLVALTVPALEYPASLSFGAIEQHQVAGVTIPLTLINRGRRDAAVAVAVTAVTPPATIAPAHDDTFDAGATMHRPTVVEGGAAAKRGPELGVSPAAVVARALRATDVTLELPRDAAAGRHQWSVALTVDGVPQAQPVMVTADLVDSRSRLIDPATGLDTLSVVFGQRVYEGVRRRYPLRILNGSAQDVSFAFRLATDAIAGELPPFRLEPEQGRLGPKEGRAVYVVFEPPLRPTRSGWASQTQQEQSLKTQTRSKRFEGLFSLLLVETEQVLNFHVAGESCETSAAVSHSVVSFGEVAMGGTVTREIELRNGVADLPLAFAFNSVANFRVTPATGSVPPGGATTVQIAFCPRRLGPFNERLGLVFNGGGVERAIALQGRSTANGPAAPSQSRRKTARVEGVSGGGSTAPIAGAASVDLPTEADIGMIPGEGLRPPALPVSVAGLQAQMREDSVGLRHTARDSDHVAPVTFTDTKALIKRTYGAAPANAAERRDCRRELQPIDLLKVSLPIKALDFDRITVGATATRSLFVYNGTDGSVLVTMPREEEPHMHFAPHAQVVPASRMAHFEVTLTGGVVQTVQQVVQFTVNARYQMRFTLQAEIAPVEVALSRTDARLEFGSDGGSYSITTAAGHPAVQTQVVMENGGSSPAPFRWTLPPQSATPPYFAIHPSHGVLAPMSKATADVLYAPPVRDGTAEVHCEAVLSVDGAVADRKLALTGVVAPVRCVWGRVAAASSFPSEEMTIELGRVAAGKDIALSLPIINRSGKNSAHYTMGPRPDGVAVSPAEGCVRPSETEELLLTFAAATTGERRHTLVCNVRGMKKPLLLHIHADVVAPPIIIAAPSLAKGELVLDYGQLYPGDERVQGVRFTNNGDVPAVVELDLRPRGHHQPQPAPASPRYRCLTEDEYVSGRPEVFPGCPLAEVGFVPAPADAQAVALKGAAAAPESPLTGRKGRADGAGRVEGMYLLTLPPLSDSVVRIAYTPKMSGAAAEGEAPQSDRLYTKWRQVGAEETHPLPSLVLHAATLPPLLSLRMREETAAGSSTGTYEELGTRSISGFATSVSRGDGGSFGITRGVFPVVVAGRLPKPIHLELRNLSKKSVAWRLLRPQSLLPASASSSEAGLGSPRGPETPFLLEPASGEIAGGGIETVTVTFLANRVGVFSEKYVLSADGDLATLCGSAIFTGTATEPRLRCEQPMVMLPPVPLGVEVSQTIYLVNDGFDSITVEHSATSASGEEAHETGHRAAAAAATAPVPSPVTVRFPMGNTISFHAPRIPVEVVFRSHQAITLNSSILLTSDREGQTIEVDVRATAINSIVTTEGYVRFSGAVIGTIADEASDGGDNEATISTQRSPQLLVRRRSTVATPGLQSKDAGSTTQAGRSRRGDRGRANLYEMVDAHNSARWGSERDLAAFIQNLTLWLNGNMIARRTVAPGTLIDTLQETHGGLLSDAIEMVFGKRPRRPAQASGAAEAASSVGRSSVGRSSVKRGAASVKSAGDGRALPAGKKARSPQSAASVKARKGLEALSALLAFLKHYGCCLSSVYLPYLLPRDEYLFLVDEEERAAAVAAQSPTARRQSEARQLETPATEAERADTTAATVDDDTLQRGSKFPVLRGEQEFAERATHAWMTVGLEVVRVFYLSRFAPEALVHVVATARPDAFPIDQWVNKAHLRRLSESNVYSREEGCVLHWIQWAANRFRSAYASQVRKGRDITVKEDPVFGSTPGPRLTGSAGGDEVVLHNFDELEDARPLIATLLFYVPAMGPHFFSGDRRVITDPVLRTDMESNADLLISALRDMGIVASATAAAASDTGAVAMSWLPTGEEWVSYSQTGMLLFCAFLLSFLTRFAARSDVALPPPPTPSATSPAAESTVEVSVQASAFASVRFEGKLLSPITKTIRIYNPTCMGVGSRQYRVRLDNTAFVVGERTLTLPTNGYGTLTVSYTPRHYRDDVGQCLLIDETPSLLPEQRAPLTLDLAVHPTDEPARVFELETPLYEAVHTEIPVANPFTSQDCCVVGIRLNQEYDGTDPDTGAPFPESDMGQRFKRAFFISTDVLPLRRGEEAFLPVHFIPMARGTYQARLTFREDAEGEFSFLVRIRCTSPQVRAFSDAALGGLVELRSEMDETTTQVLPVPPANIALDRAFRMYEERLRQQQAGGARAPTIPSFEGNTYRVAFTNMELTGPNPFFEVVPDPAAAAATVAGDDGDEDGDAARDTVTLPQEGGPGELRFLFKPKYVGEYSGCIVLSSPIDVRVFPFRGKCVQKGEQGALRFACPARQHITQNISLVNDSAEDWLLLATFDAPETGAEGSFSGPREVRVLQGRAKDYPLKYSPAWITAEEETGRLVLFNKTTGQRHTYDLVGEAEAPLSEDTVSIDCRAREKRSVTLTVPSIIPGDCTYLVEADIPFADGEPSLAVPRGSFARYTLNVAPTVGGNYTGKVIFRVSSPSQAHGRPGAASGKTGAGAERYVWFVVHLNVTPPEKEGTVVLDTDVRSPVVADVAITNPLARPLVFSVRRYGAGLLGDNTFELQANATGVYACTFAPSLIGEFEGRLSFFNDDVGEFWYEVKMKVRDAPAEDLTFEAPLGTATSSTVRLPNRSAQECQLMVQNTNTANYRVSPPVVTIPAGGEALVDITYTPTALREPQTALLTFSHAILGRWRYACSGVGSAPKDNPPRAVTGEVGSMVSVTLPFTNCLDVPTALSVAVRGDDAEACRCFSVQRAPYSHSPLPAGGRTAVVLMYRPMSVGQHSVVVEVRPAVADGNPKYDLRWRFPLEGRAEWRDSTLEPLRFRCAARKRFEDTLALPAPGLTGAARRGAAVRFEADGQRGSPAVATSFECALVPAEEAAADGDGLLRDADQVFRVHVLFTPLRPIALSGDLVIRGGGSGGGCWRHHVFLEAPPAPVDDTIALSSALHATASVSFDLYNVFPYKSKFAAYFSSDSSKDLSVVPAHGVLLPFVPAQRGSSGAVATATPIKVVFRPSLRVPQVEGTLIVDTEDMQWSFKVVGRLDNTKRPTH